MYLLVLTAVFVSENLVNGRFDSNECTKRTPINVTLPQMDGNWYTAAFVNETNVKLQMNCIMMNYSYNETTDITHEVRSAILYGKTEPEIYSTYFGMSLPGVNDVTFPRMFEALHQLLTSPPSGAPVSN